MSTPANVENKYVKLHETSAASPKVTFYGECIDASGTPPATTDLEEWGFFYSTDENAAHTHCQACGAASGDAVKVVASGTIEDNTEFSAEVDAGLSYGTMYFVNAYLYDSQSDTYFYHTGQGNTSAPQTGGPILIFQFPVVDTDDTPTVGTDDAILQGTCTGILQAFNEIKFVGFDYNEGSSIGAGFQRIIETNGTSWNNTIENLEHGTDYTYQAWMEVEESSESTATIGISGEEVTFTTESDPPIVVEAVTTTFSQTGSNSAFRTEVEFAGQMDSSGTGLTIAEELGFFYNTDVKPSNAAGTDKPSDVDPIEGSVPKDFSIDAFVVEEPGEDYYVNAYAKLSGSTDDDYYYSGGQGNTAAPDGTNYKIPKVTEPATPAMTAVLEETGSNFKVTFNANTTDAGTTGHGEKGFYYFINANSGSYYPDDTDDVANSIWDGTAGNFSHEETGLIKSTRYWSINFISCFINKIVLFRKTIVPIADNIISPKITIPTSTFE